MSEPVLAWIALASLLIVDFLAIAARAAFVQATHARLLGLREQMEREYNTAVPLMQGLPRLRASLNLLIVLARFLLAGLVIFMVSTLPIAYPFWAAVAALLLVGLAIFLLEWMVERKVGQNPEQWALRLTFFVRVVMTLLSWLLVLPFLFLREAQTSTELTGAVTADELKNLVDAGQEEGLFEQGERRMIYSIFRLAETLAREIMVPRIDMVALDVDTPLAEAADAVLNSGHSRLPVYSEAVDNTLGVLYAKDLLRAWREGKSVTTLRDLLRPVYFIPEAKRVDSLLGEMQSQRIHIALVVDEYGGVAGLVTLEDIVEEILGEIQDEYDQGEELPYQALKDGDMIFLGRVDLDHFNDMTNLDLPKEEADTLGGYIYSRLGRVPLVGEVVEAAGVTLTVEQVSARRIRKVRAHLERAVPDENEEKNHVD